MVFNEKEMAFLRILCNSEYKHLSQDYLCKKLIEAEVIKAEEFKSLKKGLISSGVIGLVYGNITIEDESVVKKVIED